MVLGEHTCDDGRPIVTQRRNMLGCEAWNVPVVFGQSKSDSPNTFALMSCKKVGYKNIRLDQQGGRHPADEGAGLLLRIHVRVLNTTA